MSELRAQVVNLLQDAWELGYECGAKDNSSARTVWTPDAMTDAELAEHGLVRMPVDADGEPIHIGDVMWQKGRITKRACKAIMGNAYVMLDGIQCAVYAKGLTHYHAPTVEDVLREFTRDWCNAACTGDMTNAERDAARANVIAEYAAKLRLADDGGEQ